MLRTCWTHGKEISVETVLAQALERGPLGNDYTNSTYWAFNIFTFVSLPLAMNVSLLIVSIVYLIFAYRYLNTVDRLQKSSKADPLKAIAIVLFWSRHCTTQSKTLTMFIPAGSIDQSQSCNVQFTTTDVLYKCQRTLSRWTESTARLKAVKDAAPCVTGAPQRTFSKSSSHFLPSSLHLHQLQSLSLGPSRSMKKFGPWIPWSRGDIHFLNVNVIK